MTKVWMAAALATAMTAGAASANTITVNGGGSLTCNGATIGACQAYTGAGGGASGGGPSGLGVLSSANADTYTGAPSSEADEATRLNTLAGTSFTDLNAARIAGGGGSLNFNTVAQYVVLKVGNVAIFVKNTSGGTLAINYTSSQGRGLSHYTQFSAVPLPGAIWLMIAGVAGLFSAQRRTKAAA